MDQYPEQINRYIDINKVATAALQSTRLLDQIRERIRYVHYSLQTEKTYLYWARFFVRWHSRNGAMRYPRDMGKAEVEGFLITTMIYTHVLKFAAGGTTSPLDALSA